MTDNLTKIHVHELRLGMFISKLDIPWSNTPFENQSNGFFIHTREQLAEIRHYCSFIYIDAQKQKHIHGAIPTGKTQQVDRLKFEKSFQKAAKTYKETSQLVKKVMEDIRFGNQLNTEVAKNAVNECVDNVLDNSDAMHLLTQLKKMDEYTSQHSLNVCILSVLFGKHLGFSKLQLQQIGLCGLLHDMGKSKVPLEILNKKGKHNDDEMVIMRNHPQLGKEILEENNDIEPIVIDVAHSHHERLDGSGYPRGITDKKIGLETRIVSIVDAYDAITSDRVYQTGLLHLDAIEILIKERNKHFDHKLVIQFIECIGIYPVGNPVEMTNGEVAMVIQSNPQQKTKPQILLLLDSEKKPCQPKYLNLADPHLVDGNGKPYKLFRVIKHNSFGLNLPQFHEMGLIEDNIKIE